ncbi:MAG: hypothetical protein R2856_26915 [Caldilineaceae bacterium]
MAAEDQLVGEGIAEDRHHLAIVDALDDRLFAALRLCLWAIPVKSNSCHLLKTSQSFYDPRRHTKIHEGREAQTDGSSALPSW